MTPKETVEVKLEELARAIDQEDSLTEDVMSRINAKSPGESDGISTLKNRFVVRRAIMNRFTKFAAAAIVLVVVLLSISLLDKSTPSAYAIGQTVEALGNVRFLYLVRSNEAGEVEDERWIEIGMDGKQIRYRQDTPPDFLVVEDGKSTAVYYKDKNTVVLYDRKDKQYQWVGPVGLVLENLRQEGKVIEENADYNGRPAHIVLWPMMNAECYIDPQTKLPMAVGDTELRYEKPAPATFEITIPQGFAVIDKRPGATPTDEPDWLTNGNIADGYFRQATHALAAGEYDKAAELFEYVVEQQSGRNWAWFWLGKAYYEQGEYGLAIEKFSNVIDMMGDVPYCNYIRGLAYAHESMDDAAKEDLAMALPWMVRSLRQPTGAAMFEYADDPLLRTGGTRPTEQQVLAKMINRLRIVTGQNFGYDPGASAQERERAMAAWEQWYENSGQISVAMDAQLIPLPAR